ncbi:MAG: hypothetical protein H0T80_13075 [Betaproteobacteria bacterium]|nr:hypothetical protein [Betaproteobacteria bacterium]
MTTTSWQPANCRGCRGGESTIIDPETNSFQADASHQHSTREGAQLQSVDPDGQIWAETKLKRYEQLASFRTSTLQDFEAGRQLEIDALVGVVADLGRITGTPTPGIDTVYSLIRLLATNLGQYPELTVSSLLNLSPDPSDPAFAGGDEDG